MAKRESKSKSARPARDDDFEVPDLSEEMIARMLESLKGGEIPGFGEDPADELNEAFEDFLALDGPSDGDDEDEIEEDELDPNEVFSRLADALEEVRIGANGGDPRARKAIAGFRERLEEAITDEDIHPANLIMLGKVLWKSQTAVPESLRTAVGGAIGGDAFEPDNAEGFVRLSLAAMGEIDDPFDLYDESSSNMAGFPTRHRIALALPLISSKKPVIRVAAIGFVLHPEEELARAVIKAFPFSAPSSASENEIVARLRTVAAWLPAERREMAEAAFAAMPSGPRPAPAAVKIIKIVASAHDGSGANTLVAAVKQGKHFVNLSVLMKAEGVVEVVEYSDLARKDSERMIELLGATSPMVDISAGGAGALIELALGRNLSAGALPPFRLLRFCEALGLEAPRPDISNASRIFETRFEPPPGEDPAADAGIVESPFVQSWFEAGEGVDKLLGSTKARKLATRKVLNEYLPARRPFWAMLCATTALVFKSRSGNPDEAWKSFARIGRAIASQAPLDSIPLMEQIAARTVEAYFARK